jgi:TonB family protein
MLFSQPKRGSDAVECRSHLRIVWKLTDNTTGSSLYPGDMQLLMPPPSRYPAQARTEHREGATVITITIGGKGEILLMKIEKSSGSDDLDQAAMNYAKTLRFQPGTVNGMPTISGIGITVIWTLDPNEGLVLEKSKAK